MALITSSSNAKLNPSPIPTSVSLKCKVPISQCSVSKPLPSRVQYPISKFGTSSSSHNHYNGTLKFMKKLTAKQGKGGWIYVNAHDEKTKKIIALASTGDVIQEPYSHRIWLSNVVVKSVKNVFGGRKWSSLDVATLSLVVLMHGMAMFAPFVFNWGAFWVAFVLYFASGLLGICLSFHRNLSHRSFKLPKWLEYFCAYCGVLALQGNPIDWVSTHRYHHQYCDSEQDPHSPLEGFWFSHMNWLFDTRALTERCGEPSNVGDLEKQPFYRFMRNSYILHPLALGLLLYAFGGFPYLVWGMGVRTIWIYHITWLVNSACHVWGTQAWNTGDLSRNNWWVALLSFGEGWHNNHHAFEYSARHGLEWWQMDMTWYTVKLFQAIGLAKDVKLPTEAHKQRLALRSQNVEA